ncbi:MAG TPA: STAS domain-containing protein [Anaeromyxobacteraceae bacterium]|nr:STAS domain-containing protein [Anaeromyxobacteraceae bacterium]
MQSEAAALPETVIRLQGVFDATAAERLGTALAAAGPQARLEVDLSQVQEVHDSALAGLAPLLSRAVALRGLRLHHIRLLRYFGVDLAKS